MYIILKSSRWVHSPSPKDAYRGPSCVRAGIKPGKLYNSRSAAEADRGHLNNVNPVGFVIVPVDNKL